MDYREFLDYLKLEKKFSAHTIVSYQNDIKQFNEFVLKQYSSSDYTALNSIFIRSWINELSNDDFSPVSINRKLSSLRSFVKFLLKKKLVSSDPFIKIHPPKKPKHLPVFVDESKMKELVEKFNSTSGSEEKESNFLSQVVVEMLYQTGMRRSELSSLKEKDIDFYQSQIKVLGKGNKERIIPISEDLKSLMRQWLDQKAKSKLPTEFFLVNAKGKKMNDKSIYLLVRSSIGKVSTLKKKSPHVLRHSFATHMLNNGADINAVKELLGHTSLAATQVYTHNSIEKLKSAYKKSHPRSSSASSKNK
ncbi:MAG: tyrosine-type recombinase/integrase [Bacteroidota bacterium]|jgi:integrase/recombinase XerC